MKPAPLGLLLVLGASVAHADELVIYRCTDVTGALAIQNMPCPAGTPESRTVMQVPQPAPAPAPAAAPLRPLVAANAPLPAAAKPVTEAEPARAAAPPGATVAATPPPPLFHCASRDGEQILQEHAQPASRCLPLRTVGLDGNPQAGAGEACEVVQDRCTQVPDTALCDSWKQSVAEAGMHWRMAGAHAGGADGAEFERLRAVVAASNCPR